MIRNASVAFLCRAPFAGSPAPSKNHKKYPSTLLSSAGTSASVFARVATGCGFSFCCASLCRGLQAERELLTAMPTTGTSDLGPVWRADPGVRWADVESSDEDDQPRPSSSASFSWLDQIAQLPEDPTYSLNDYFYRGRFCKRRKRWRRDRAARAILYARSSDGLCVLEECSNPIDSTRVRPRGDRLVSCCDSHYSLARQRVRAELKPADDPIEYARRACCESELGLKFLDMPMTYCFEDFPICAAATPEKPIDHPAPSPNFEPEVLCQTCGHRLLPRNLVRRQWQLGHMGDRGRCSVHQQEYAARQLSVITLRRTVGTIFNSRGEVERLSLLPLSLVLS